MKCSWLFKLQSAASKEILSSPSGLQPLTWLTKGSGRTFLLGMPSTHFVGKCGGEGCSSPKTPGVSCGLHKAGFPSSPRTQEAWCYSSLLVVLSPSDSSSACAHLPHGHCIPQGELSVLSYLLLPLGTCRTQRLRQGV